jgi:DNA-binding MarR family transcriptional regulator
MTRYLSCYAGPVRSAPRRLRKHHSRGELRAVVDETIALFHRLRWVAEQIYGEEGRSVARRGILRGLVRYGPQTVPQLARARLVTRQHVQPVVDALARDGLVEIVPNPKHARSRLVRATARGEALVRRFDTIDDRVLAVVGRGLPARDLAVAAAALRALRERFENATRWRLALEQLGL